VDVLLRLAKKLEVTFVALDLYRLFRCRACRYHLLNSFGVENILIQLKNSNLDIYI
jgi:hypothetical protein